MLPNLSVIDANVLKLVGIVLLTLFLVWIAAFCYRCMVDRRASTTSAMIDFKVDCILKYRHILLQCSSLYKYKQLFVSVPASLNPMLSTMAVLYHFCHCVMDYTLLSCSTHWIKTTLPV